MTAPTAQRARRLCVVGLYQNRQALIAAEISRT
jgi:hypothetical protein